MVTVKQVSELSGVSQATVSRVINGNARVSHDKKLRVEKAIRELGYRPKSVAYSAALNRSGSIGLVLPEFEGPFYGTMMSVIEEALRPLCYQLLVTSGGKTPQSEQMAIDFLLSRRVDALIIYTSFLSDDYLIDLVNQDPLTAILGRSIPELHENCIVMDDELGGKLACRHLIGLGHRRIACITGPLIKPHARARLQGYRIALEEANIAYDERLVVEADFSEAMGARAMNKLLNRGADFTAVFCCNDLMAIGAIDTLNKTELNTKEPISIVGFDNILLSKYMTPPLTTVHNPVEKMAVEAVHLLLQKANKQKLDIQFKFSPTLVVRESTQAAPKA